MGWRRGGEGPAAVDAGWDLGRRREAAGLGKKALCRRACLVIRRRCGGSRIRVW